MPPRKTSGSTPKVVINNISIKGGMKKAPAARKPAAPASLKTIIKNITASNFPAKSKTQAASKKQVAHKNPASSRGQTIIINNINVMGADRKPAAARKPPGALTASAKRTTTVQEHFCMYHQNPNHPKQLEYHHPF